MIETVFRCEICRVAITKVPNEDLMYSTLRIAKNRWSGGFAAEELKEDYLFKEICLVCDSKLRKFISPEFITSETPTTSGFAICELQPTTEAIYEKMHCKLSKTTKKTK